MEFNKLLERNGFRKVRARKSIFRKKMQKEAFPTVRYLFAGCSWRNPSVEEERQELEKGWHLLAKSSMPFKSQCSLGRFLALCKEFHDEWNAFHTGYLSCLGDGSSPGQSSLGNSDSDEDCDRPSKKQRCKENEPEILLSNSTANLESESTDFSTTYELPTGMQHPVDTFYSIDLPTHDTFFETASQQVDLAHGLHDFALTEKPLCEDFALFDHNLCHTTYPCPAPRGERQATFVREVA
eukprot:766464-Hanusia_phi.AAC.8